MSESILCRHTYDLDGAQIEGSPPLDSIPVQEIELKDRNTGDNTFQVITHAHKRVGATISGGYQYYIGDAPADYQVNGTHGEGGHAMFTGTPTAETLRKMAAHTMATGTSRFCPVIITSSFGRIVAALEALKSIHPDERKKLGILPIHVEGRWIDKSKKGIHNPRHIVARMTRAECDTLCDYAQQGILGMITISPNKVTANQIKQLKAAGAIVSIGHSDATFAQTNQAIDDGVEFITHTGNAMSGALVTRQTKGDPKTDFGVLGAAMVNPKVIAGFIGDEHHLHDPFMQHLLNSVGACGPNGTKKRGAATSDAATYPSQDDYVFRFGPGGVNVRYNSADNTCKGPDGTLGGASVTMSGCIQRAVRLKVPLQNAIHMASQVFLQLLAKNQPQHFQTNPLKRVDDPAGLDNMALYNPNGGVVGIFKDGELHVVGDQELKTR